MKSVEWFGFGFVSCLAVVASAVLMFVLFCPIWQEWIHKEAQVHVVNPPPQIYFIPNPDTAINFGNQSPDKAPDIFPKTD
jgi:hypothetical protein